MAVIDTISRTINLRQYDDEDLVEYVKRFKVQMDIMKGQMETHF